MPTVNVRDRNARQFFFRDSLEAPQIDPVHHSDGRLGADPKRSHTAALAEVVLVLHGIEQVLDQLILSGEQAEATFSCHGGPEARPSADGAVAPIGVLSEIEISLEPDGATVTTAAICLQHEPIP